MTMLVMASVTFAQTPQGGTEGVVIRQRMVQGPDGAPPPPFPPGDVLFIASESFGGKVVKGAPYSAESVTESVQVLGDGNRIVNKFTSMVYRDSEGRTRREQTLKALGVLGTGAEPLQTIFINDPIAGVTFSLDSRTRTANKSTPFKFEFTQKAGAAGTDGEGRHFEFKVAPGGNSANMIMTAPMGVPPAAPGTRVAVAQTEHFSIGTGGGASTYVFRSGGPNQNEVKENLGKQMIEGVEAEGTRSTITIPAGTIGNERAIDIVSERWYSPELQLVVMTRHSDPRTGETTYKLTNINRTEPAKSLFEVPSDYTVKEGAHPAPVPARVRKLANPE
ncbi:MAG TPA: hypothetical protein VFS77_07480 [Pyrinomonadaceae bacterium]|nr:hypothetical protein [Pyrinomonadaceae bacterium]